MIKLLALDMDGTLLHEDKSLSQENIDAIHQAIDAGVQLVLCTGRPLVGVKPYFEKLGLTEKEYMIINNGCTTLETKDWSLVDWRELTTEDIQYLYEVGQQAPAQLTLFDMDHYLVVEEEATDLVTYDAGLVFTTPTRISLEQALSAKDIIFQAMFLAEKAHLDSFQEQFGAQLEERFSGVRSQPVIYECMPKGTTKASALARLSDKLGIQASEIMAIGDANNDIEMLEFAGLGIAMGNAAAHIKELAQDVTLTNDENGVAAAIRKHILN